MANLERTPIKIVNGKAVHEKSVPANRQTGAGAGLGSGAWVWVASAVIAAIAIKTYLDGSASHSDKKPPVSRALFNATGSHKRTPEQHWGFILNHPTFVSTYGEVQGNHLDVDMFYERDLMNGAGDITRCAITQFAITHYFCGPHVALWDVDGNRQLSLSKFIEHAFGPLIKKGKQVPEVLFRLHLPSIGDHTLALHMLPNGRFSVYQSFIDGYSLKRYMTTGAQQLFGGPTMDLDRVLQFLDRVYIVARAKDWTPDVKKAYSESFWMTMSESQVGLKVTESGGDTARVFEGVALTWNIACLPQDAKSMGVHSYVERAEEMYEQEAKELDQSMHSLVPDKKVDSKRRIAMSQALQYAEANRFTVLLKRLAEYGVSFKTPQSNKTKGKGTGKVQETARASGAKQYEYEEEVEDEGDH